MSEHPNDPGIPRVVLERECVAERWRSEPWNAIVANGPVWHDRFSGMATDCIDPDAVPPKDKMVDWYATGKLALNSG